MKTVVPTRTTQSRAVTSSTPASAARTARPAPPGCPAPAGRCCASAPARAGDRRARDASPRPRVQQVGEQTVGARHAGRELPEERQAGVDERARAVANDQQRALRWLLAGIVDLEDRSVLLVPLGGEVETALLDPALVVRRG